MLLAPEESEKKPDQEGGSVVEAETIMVGVPDSIARKTPPIERLVFSDADPVPIPTPPGSCADLSPFSDESEMDEETARRAFAAVAPSFKFSHNSVGPCPFFNDASQENVDAVELRAVRQ